MSEELNKPALDVFDAARTRRSIRAYRRDPVPRAILREIVALGRHAPSGSNIQPWRVHVLTGATLARVGAAIKQAFLDYGMFLQTIMLAARARGLHTCPEASIASYPDIVRRELDISDDWIVVCGMAMGYADAGAIINGFQPPRIAVDEYAVFLD